MRRLIAERYIRHFQLPADQLYAWGRKPSGKVIRQRARRLGKPVVCLEDGFLRSMGLGRDAESLSLCVDDIGIYYDAKAPSRLEALIRKPLEPRQLQRAQALRQDWQGLRLSKYNGAPDSPAPEEPFVLVVDQTAGDLSISHGLADCSSFQHMLTAALDGWPDHRIVVKVHPDVAARRKRGHFNLRQLNHPRIQVCADGGHPCSVLESCSAVYVVTSQLGFEGLLWGKQVHVFGMPFYAGWGLTFDFLPTPSRRIGTSPVVEQLVHAALVAYPCYIHPETGHRCEPEDVMAWMALQHRRMLAFPDHLEAFGFTPWKARQLRRFIPRGRGQSLRFRQRHNRPALNTQGALVWGRRESDGVKRSRVQTIQVEDGFVRSVGLGANLVDPLSWVFDSSGIYYDASRPSDLETMLRNSCLSPDQRNRARHLRNQLINSGITKYNLGGQAWNRPPLAAGRLVVLVLGQVEGDASIRYGLPPDAKVRTNRQLLEAARAKFPDAWLVYKPHPDVVAGLRAQGGMHNSNGEVWDQLVPTADLSTLLGQVDHVCVLTSLGGFEALLRRIPVSTWGLPFYAGWHLSDDELGTHPWIARRRGRELHLDALTYESLIRYPSYISEHSKQPTTPERVIEELTAIDRDKTKMSIEQLIFRWWGALRSRICGQR